MRMWNVPPQGMCRKHLLGEHVECHMFVGSIQKGTNLKGYVSKGLVEIHNIHKRHTELATEMVKRGYKHNSPLPEVTTWNEGNVDPSSSLLDLINRCPECRTLMSKMQTLTQRS